VGSNLHERRFFDDVAGGSPVFDRASLELTVRLTYGDAANAILEHYAPASDGDAKDAWVRLWTDEYFRCPARWLARLASEQGRAAYLYNFEAPPAVHSQDLDYVFAWPCCGVSASYPAEAGYPLLAQVVSAVQGYWTNLARTGDPNGQQLPLWPAYTPSNDAHMTLGPVVAAGTALSRADCDFWEELYEAP
jgi:carboxylesterase type B